MKTRFSIALFALLFSLHGLGVNAQSFAPLGTYWNYDFTSHNGGMDAQWSIKVTKDTIIDGYPTKYLTRYFYNTYHYPPSPWDPISGSQDISRLQYRGDSVFTDYNTWPVGFTNYLFSFSMAIGDTIQIQSFVNIYAVVNSISDTIIGNDTLTRWHLDKYCDTNFWNAVTIVENVGPVDDYLFWNDDGCAMTVGTAYFRCFASPDFNFNEPCWQILGNTNEFEKTELLIFPNPNNGNFILSYDLKESNGMFIIYNSLGQMVYESPLPQRSGTLERNITIPPGIYLWEINCNGTILKQSKMIVE